MKIKILYKRFINLISPVPFSVFFSHDFNDNEKVQPLLFAHYLALLARKSHQIFTCSMSTTTDIFGVFIVNFEQVSYLSLVFLALTLIR